MQSLRKDGKGHWPAGVPRNSPPPSGLIEDLEDIVEAELASIRYLAEKIGVDDRTLRRWLSGDDNPSPHYYSAIRRVVKSF